MDAWFWPNANDEDDEDEEQVETANKEEPEVRFY